MYFYIELLAQCLQSHPKLITAPALNSNCVNKAQARQAQPQALDTRQSTVTALDGTKTLRQIILKPKVNAIYICGLLESHCLLWEKPSHTIAKERGAI